VFRRDGSCLRTGRVCSAATATRGASGKPFVAAVLLAGLLGKDRQVITLEVLCSQDLAAGTLVGTESRIPSLTPAKRRSFPCWLLEAEGPCGFRRDGCSGCKWEAVCRGGENRKQDLTPAKLPDYAINLDSCSCRGKPKRKKRNTPSRLT